MFKNLNFGKVAVEMVSIIFAVLLALWLEGWREDVERLERADLMLERITSEVTNNRREIIKAIAENQSYMAGLQNALKQETLEFSGISPFLQLSAGSTGDSAWSSARMTNVISVMPISTVTALAGVYDTQEYYVEFAQNFIQRYADFVIYGQSDDQMKLMTRKFIANLGILNILAGQLVKGYDDFLKLKK